MLKLCVFIICSYLLIYETSADGNGTKHKLIDIPLLDKNDYQLDFHRMELVRFDKRYMQLVNVVTYKYNRTCPLVNATMNFLLDVGRNMEVIAQAYRFASNEYRLFPLRFEVNSCQAWDEDIGGIKDISKCGNFKSCTPSKGINYTFCNWAPNATRFPPFIPNGDYKIELEFLHRTTELFVLAAYATVSRPILHF